MAGDSAGRGGGRTRTVNDSAGRGGLAGLLPAGVTAAMMAPLVYDVVNRKGELVHRVQLPSGRQLVGFGPGGTIFLSVREGRELFLEKTRIVN